MYFPKPAINENDLAIIERGDTAEHSISAGQYVSWKGKLGKAVSAILQGATLEDTMFDYETDGFLNEKMKSKFLSKSVSGTTDSDGMLNAGLSATNYMPVAFIYGGVSGNTSGYYFSLYNNNWYITIVNKSVAKYASVSISGTLYYLEVA